MDIPESQENFELIKKAYAMQDIPVYPISAASNQGLDQILLVVSQFLDGTPQTIIFSEDFEPYEESVLAEEPFTVDKIDEETYSVQGKTIEKMLGYTNIDTEKGLAFFQKYLREKGIISLLVEKGIKEGNTVRLYDLEFEYYT